MCLPSPGFYAIPLLRRSGPRPPGPPGPLLEHTWRSIRVQARRSQGQLPDDGGGGPRVLAGEPDLREVDLAARGRAGVRVLRRPPFATGLPHFGHFVPGTIKDIIPRYQTMKGCKVERRFGWDCHGLPVEYEMEKELGISGKTRDRGATAWPKFNEACRSIVLRYTKEWRTIITAPGPLGGLRPRLQDHGPRLHGVHLVGGQASSGTRACVYEGHYILPYCPRCSTVLSEPRAAPRRLQGRARSRRSP
ncbi:MAG: class I tRNA ligase family protein [Candidatus Moduliflexus flocculans]|nr:class I tRNA ligase family protein [Candidatus Moduliflexus flocculans]